MLIDSWANHFTFLDYSQKLGEKEEEEEEEAASLSFKLIIPVRIFFPLMLFIHLILDITPRRGKAFSYLT